ncbi:hypothetical protein AGMMS49525_02420 [Bacteroidia bacterium]|nr:hypothetical protein AGMMS49525_02420 [Bacteroidia bacterium]
MYVCKLKEGIKKLFFTQQVKSKVIAMPFEQALFQKHTLLIGSYALNVQMNLLKFANGKPHQISPRECDILKLLSQNAEKIVTRDFILSSCWETTSGYASRSLDLFIYRLRKELILDPKVKIYTIRGKGFILTTNHQPD